LILATTTAEYYYYAGYCWLLSGCHSFAVLALPGDAQPSRHLPPFLRQHAVARHYFAPMAVASHASSQRQNSAGLRLPTAIVTLSATSAC